MDYVPHTPEDQQEMLTRIGMASLEDLFGDIPERLKLRRSLALPEALAEQDLASLMSGIAVQNTVFPITLMGAGAYRHYIPAVVRHVTGLPAFSTAYTPYQSEISQGILQAIFEYQTMIARLTGMSVANASLYDGATALAEACLAAARIRECSRIVVARAVHPEYRRVLRTYAWASGCDVVEVPYDRTGRVDRDVVGDMIGPDTACAVVQSPNFFGVIEDLAAIASAVHDRGALLVAGFTEAVSLGLLKPPGMLGADIVFGEGQSFGNPLAFGGPYLGIFAGRDDLLRRMPGRIVGETTDAEGRRGFVLTIQTREQHIRREKATSNICTNEALCALAAAVYLTCLGKNLRSLAELNVHKACYLRDRLSRRPGWEAVFPGPTFNEFVMACPSPGEAMQRWRRRGIMGGYELGREYPELPNCLVLCATEMLGRSDMDAAADAVSDA